MSIFRPGLFKDKVAIVTGGGSGIGMAIATELLTLGNNKNVVHLFVKFMHWRADTTCLPIRKCHNFNSVCRLQSCYRVTKPGEAAGRGEEAVKDRRVRAPPVQHQER